MNATPKPVLTHDFRLAPGWRIFGQNAALQTPFDVAVIMPTVGRDTLGEAIQSVYRQQDCGRIQLLIGVDAPLGDLSRLQVLLDAPPAHVTPCLFYPGYSTSVRHGGLHRARDGGALRVVLSYLANARYLTYLDDDNWWGPLHMQALLKAVQGRDWAFALRWFLDSETRKPLGVDGWESVGPGRGVFAKKFGGWVDPNCLILDKVACESALRWWGVPLPKDPSGMSADRHVFQWLKTKSAPGETGLASVFYAMQTSDGHHAKRMQRLLETQTKASDPPQHDDPAYVAKPHLDTPA